MRSLDIPLDTGCNHSYFVCLCKKNYNYMYYDFCIDFCSENNKVSHYIISRRGGLYLIGDQTFTDLPSVIEFYRSHFLDTTTLVQHVRHNRTCYFGQLSNKNFFVVVFRRLTQSKVLVLELYLVPNLLQNRQTRDQQTNHCHPQYQ